MKAQMTDTDIVIVGGGMAGLTAACYLARVGKAVTLFEKAAGVGGRAATQHYDGYSFNRGIHALYTGGAATVVLEELGITYSYGIPNDVFLLQGGKLYPNPADPLTLIRSKLLDFGDKVEAMRFFALLPRIKAQSLANMCVQEWLERTIRRTQIRRMMEVTAYTFCYSAALDLVSADVFVEKVQRWLKHPIHYIDEGWQTLVNSLRQMAEKEGARIVSGARVEAVMVEQGEVQGVRLRDGSIVRASSVIIATSPDEAVKLIDEDTYPKLRQIVDGLVPAQVACLDVALSCLPDPRYPVVQDVEQPRFLTTQSVYARVAPQGGAVISAFKQLHPAHPTDAKEDERELEQFLDGVQPGWREVVVKRVYLPRIEAVGALPLARDGGLAGRPSLELPGLANVYLAGDWVGPEGFLVDASMSSARQVAQMLMKGGSLHREISMAHGGS